MGQTAPIIDRAKQASSKNLKLSYTLRLVAYLLLLCLYLSLFAEGYSPDPILIAFIVAHTIVYPHLAYHF